MVKAQSIEKERCSYLSHLVVTHIPASRLQAIVDKEIDILKRLQAVQLESAAIYDSFVPHHALVDLISTADLAKPTI
jgi:hypothetical protein